MTTIMAASSEATRMSGHLLLGDFFTCDLCQFSDFIAVRHFGARFEIPNSLRIMRETGGCFVINVNDLV